MIMDGHCCSMNTVHVRRPICQDSSNTYVHRNHRSRRYEKRARAAQEQETRQRIIEAALALHGTVGPARTTDLGDRRARGRAPGHRLPPLPRRARRCSWAAPARGGSATRCPIPPTWAPIPDPAARLDGGARRALRVVRARRADAQRRLRDVDAVPIVAEIQEGRYAYLAAVEDGLAAGWGARGNAARRLRATIGLALDFLAWRTLHERGLSRADAIAVMSSAVSAAAAASS